jgi:hypothetical protein
MAQEPSSKDLLEAVKQQESGGRRYKADGKTLLEGPQTKYGTAKGEMQVLDMTNKDPGYGVKPAQDNSPDERARVGRDYLNAMVKRYGNKETALVAYNWGPGNTDKWLDKGGDFSKLPKETQNYVTKITGALGSTKLAQATPTQKSKAGVQRVGYKAASVGSPLLSQLGPNYQAAIAVSMLADEAEKEGKDEDAPSESERMLAAMPSKPAPAVDLDLSYQSPFPEIQAQAAPVARKPLPLLRPVRMAKGGEVDYFQDPMGVPDSGPVTADTLSKGKEFKSAEALQALKDVGTGAARNLKNILQGVTETPYNLVGGAADIGNLVLTPIGLGSKEPTGGSAQLKRLATEAGIRPAPPTDPRDAGFYMMGELGASVVNPGPIAAKVGQATEKAVAKGGKAVAKEMLRGMEGKGVLAPVSPQDAIMYAVKPKGGAFTGTREYEFASPGTEGREVFEDSVTSLIKSGELMPDVRPELKIPIQSRKALNSWVEDRIGNYIRRDMATPNDPFVKAVDEGKKLHLLEGLGDIKPMSNLARRRDKQGFPAWGSAKTPLGRKLEKQIDSSMWSEDIGDVDTYNIHPSMESFKDTNPNMQVYNPGAQIANRMQFPKMMEGMEDMLTEKRYTAYGDTSTPIPQEYQLTPEKLQGLSPVDASEKVGLFNQWRDKERQVQAAQYLDKYGNTYKKYDNGRKWIAMDDLASEPKQAELVQQAGCLGGWCTKDEKFAYNGSGENRLHILFDEKATPRVQLTVTKKEANADDFITQLEYDEFNQFEQSHGNVNSLPAWLVESTPEYQAWARMQGNPERITELKGQFNTESLVKDPNSRKYLKEVQDFVKSKDWGSVANLDGINMVDLDDYIPTLSRGLNLQQANQLSDFMKSLNGGSRFADKYEGENIVREAAMRAFQPPTPPGRATGGMVERQTSAAQYI